MCPAERILELLRSKFTLLSATGSPPPSDSTAALRDWLSVALEGRALQTAPTVCMFPGCLSSMYSDTAALT